MKFLERVFVPALVAFLFGIGFAAYALPSFAFGMLFLLVGVAALALSAFYENKMRLLLVGACAVLFALGMFRFSFWASAPDDPSLVAIVGETVILRGVVIDDPDVREKNTQLKFRIEKIVNGSEEVAAAGGLLVIVSRYPEYRYGDMLEFRGKVVRPKEFSGDDGRVFDYPNYLKAKGVAYQIFYPDVRLLGQNGGSAVRAKLFQAKHAFLDRLALALPEPENALAGGILLGGKRSLGEAWTERFRESGLVHIVVLSGYNMTIVAEWLGSAFLFLGFYGSLAVSAFGITIFALTAGAGATVVRAAIMALLVLLARLTGRTSTMGRTLLVAGVLMVLHNPSILAFDPSFQLSFLASLGLVFVAPLIRLRIHFFRFFRGHPVVEEAVVSTLATQVMVLPLLLYQTGLLSVIAIAANVLVLPFIPAAMITAFITGLVGFLGTFPALIAALPTQALLSYVLAVAKYGAALPFAAVHLPPIPGWSVFLLYGVLAFVIYRSSREVSQDVEGPHQVRR